MIPQGYPLVARTADERVWLIVGWIAASPPRPVGVPWESGLSQAVPEVAVVDGAEVHVPAAPDAEPVRLPVSAITEWGILTPDGRIV